MSLLLVDSYDSFTANLESLLAEVTHARVLTVRNDSFKLPAESSALDDLLDSVDGVVIGPGPGSPLNTEDVGIIPYILNRQKLPILGICLGFQCLCLHYGCTMDYLKEPVHGQVYKMTKENDDGLLDGIPDGFESVRYHSIYIDKVSEDIVPLASTQGILMAARHKQYPHYGVQYHPESICSKYGGELVRNWWKLVDAKHKPVNFFTKLVSYKSLIPKMESGQYDYRFRQIGPMDPVEVCNHLDDFLLLQSASSPGEWSIVGCPIRGESEVISHASGQDRVTLGRWKDSSTTTIQTPFWPYCANFMAKRYFQPEIPNKILRECPFVGGLVGVISYEEACDSDSGYGTDSKLCFVERFVAIKRETKETFLVSLRGDEGWLDEMEETLTKDITPASTSLEGIIVTKPNKESYYDQFDECQKYLHSGDSYELCLTTTTTLEIPESVPYWEVYKKMAAANGSPYSVFMDFGDLQLLSTSPERFLSWNEESCQMRPIKGTVKKTEEVDFQKASELLLIPKEMGENLMIVDLIRHDLHSLLKEVKVSKLMGVEEYHTVYQLVSVIEGTLKDSGYRGIDVLRQSLPPGSMTGAPKKRSVELLTKIEGAPRGLYSGVAGFWGVNDVADWSVVIRSLYGYGDHTLKCGAGGAITVMSKKEAEWEEMLVKLESAVRWLDKE